MKATRSIEGKNGALRESGTLQLLHMLGLSQHDEQGGQWTMVIGLVKLGDVHRDPRIVNLGREYLKDHVLKLESQSVSFYLLLHSLELRLCFDGSGIR